jgi:hypothetical protein
VFTRGKIQSLASPYIFAVTGAAWAVAGLVSLARDEPTHALDAWMLVTIGMTYLALSGLASTRWPSLPQYARTGFGLLLTMAPPMVVGHLAALFDWDSLKWLGFPVGVLGWIVGSALFGIGLAQQNGLSPRWAGYAIAVAQPGAIVTGIALSPIRELSDYGSYTGAVAHAVVWFAIAWTVRGNVSHRPRIQSAPSRAS